MKYRLTLGAPIVGVQQVRAVLTMLTLSDCSQVPLVA